MGHKKIAKRINNKSQHYNLYSTNKFESISAPTSRNNNITIESRRKR
jgi:hypothetical protein